MSILVTVGTTKFEELVKEVDRQEFHNKLLILGYNKLIIQYGSGDYKPAERRVKFGQDSSLENDLEITSVSYMKEIAYGDYDLIICHAGAGSILNSLRNNRRTIVVVNNKLMDNHQSELAFQLHNDKYLIAIQDPKDLVNSIELATKSTDIAQFPKADNSTFKEFINDIVNRNIWK
ncbi:glycosyl transferase [Cryptosporidium xiaoi]|uniref:UDP-N-acetylglucosamine transferase subunit ALG13 n=1 Tax=Cryptosporidium xiaoi TaxID=659607 RepID=A0AAV9Y165_9CRYT